MMRITPRATPPLTAAVACLFLVALAACEPATQKQAPSDPSAFTLADWPAEPAAARGRIVYQENCAGCHGDAGLGDGPGAEFLDPLPRNFQSGKFKFRTTASGELPLITDIARTVTCGLPGSAMPGFPLLNEVRRHDVAAFVLYLAQFGRAKRQADGLVEGEGLTMEQVRKERMEEIRARAKAPPRLVVAPPEPPVTDESLRRGKAVYETQCIACHGVTGRGDGVSSDAMRDWQDAEIRARDFTSGVFRTGSSPSDLFLRMRTGLNGTPMPSSGVTDAELWDIVHYVVSLKRPGVIPVTRRAGCTHEEPAK